MCIIIAKPRGVELPPISHMEESWYSNSDGFGCLWSVKGKINSYKTMDEKACMDFYKNLLKEKDRWLDVPIIFHFRFATHGSKKLSNCHAYCDNDATVGFQHNGVLRLNVPVGMDITDSEYFFRYMFMPCYTVSGKSISTVSHVIDNLRGASDKFAFIHGNEIYLFGTFSEDNGAYYSNRGYIGHNSYSKAYNKSYIPQRQKTHPMPSYSRGAEYHCQNCKAFDCMRCDFYND